MKARPILMHARSIQNLLAGQKTQTRRIMRTQPPADEFGAFERMLVETIIPTTVDRHGDEQPGTEVFGVTSESGEWCLACPYGQPGDLLWVRETWRAPANNDPWPPRALAHNVPCWYPADDGKRMLTNAGTPGKKRPGIHMPRWASRLTLKLTAVRVHRVQNTSLEDIGAEGVRVPMHDGHVVIELTGKSPPARFLTKDQLGDAGALMRAHWASLWEQTNGAGAWSRNDWCWALTFEVLRENVDAVLTGTKVAA